MRDDEFDTKPESDEPASNRLAAFLRDCLLLLIVFGMVVWLVYFAITAIVTGHLYIKGARLSRHWTPHSFDGLPAVLAGFSFLSLAAAFISICLTHPRIAPHIPRWVRVSYWWFFVAFGILYFTARFISDS
jgi:hypothetical protein